MFSSHFLALFKQQQERPERGFEPWPLRCRCSAPLVELSGQLGAGHYVGRIQSTYHLLRGTHVNPGGMVQFWYFFTPCGRGELFSFGKNFAGPRGHTHGICSRQCDRQGEKCLTWCKGRCVKMSKRREKKLDTFVYFCQWKVWWNGLTMKGWKKVVMLFLTTSNRYYVVGVHTSP